mmetsp:Transcript_14559/g.37763  ORF Transcript_14559/g.37763 Transcript_14559/m.37763 type:complete len:263 (-) Transcript_14559:91-879(-)
MCSWVRLHAPGARWPQVAPLAPRRGASACAASTARPPRRHPPPRARRSSSSRRTLTTSTARRTLSSRSRSRSSRSRSRWGRTAALRARSARTRSRRCVRWCRRRSRRARRSCGRSTRACCRPGCKNNSTRFRGTTRTMCPGSCGRASSVTCREQGDGSPPDPDHVADAAAPLHDAAAQATQGNAIVATLLGSVCHTRPPATTVPHQSNGAEFGVIVGLCLEQLTAVPCPEPERQSPTGDPGPVSLSRPTLDRRSAMLTGNNK